MLNIQKQISSAQRARKNSEDAAQRRELADLTQHIRHQLRVSNSECAFRGGVLEISDGETLLRFIARDHYHRRFRRRVVCVQTVGPFGKSWHVLGTAPTLADLVGLRFPKLTHPAG